VKNLGSVMVAYMIGWGVFFVYLVTVARDSGCRQVRRDRQALANSSADRTAAGTAGCGVVALHGSRGRDRDALLAPDERGSR
jgi:hypothetical protein